MTLLRRLGNHSRRNRLYKALRELGRVIRTITLLRYLSEPELRDQIAVVTNRTEQFHNFSQFLMIGGRLIGHNDPDYQERVVKFNELVANAAIFSTALDITDAANALASEGDPVDTDDLATVSPYITRTIRRFGSWVVDLTPPDHAPATPPGPGTACPVPGLTPEGSPTMQDACEALAADGPAWPLGQPAVRSWRGCRVLRAGRLGAAAGAGTWFTGAGSGCGRGVASYPAAGPATLRVRLLSSGTRDCVEPVQERPLRPTEDLRRIPGRG